MLHDMRGAGDDLAAGRQAGPDSRCWSIWPGSSGSTTSGSPTWTIRRSSSASAPAGTAARRSAARSPRRTSRRSRRRSATTAAARASTARSTWARTRTRCPSRPSAPPSRCWPPTASRRSSSATTASRRRRSSRGPILAYNRGRTAHLADGIVITPSHNPPEDGGFKYNPPNGGPADTDVTEWIQDRANELLRAGNAGVKRVPFATAIKAATTHQEDFVLPYVQRSARTSSTWTPSASAGLDAGRGSARRRGEAVLGADQRRLRAQHRRRQPGDRPDVLVHDGRSRRQDPHGPLEPVRDGAARRAEGSVPRRLRQRSRLRTGTAS